MARGLFEGWQVMITIQPPLDDPFATAIVDAGPTIVLPARERALWLAFRQALLMIVDAIEVYIGTDVRTAELRKRAR